MFDEVLIESSGKSSRAGTWITALISAVVHLLIVGAIVAAGLYVNENPEVIEKPMSAFIVASAPPPPPPPPPAGSAAAQQRAPIETPRETRREQFIQPRETPRDVPVVDEPEAEPGAVPGGMPGGRRGGEAGGVVGGVEGGERGGQLNGVPGGQTGGTGTGTGPVRVGGNVKAPVAVLRVDPIYTEVARRARVEGIVIIEAVIDQQGNVTEARVLKPLPFGLDAAALSAVKQWKFRPGTLEGKPVPVYYNLTVNFRIE